MLRFVPPPSCLHGFLDGTATTWSFFLTTVFVAKNARLSSTGSPSDFPEFGSAWARARGVLG